MKVTLIGTLPPIKGISPYCLELVNALSKKVEVEFIGFKELYPEFLYPGGTKMGGSYKLPETGDIKNIITYYNPLTWLSTGYGAKGNIIHVQWWAHVLAPIYLIFLSMYKMRRKKVVMTIHNVLPHETNKLNEFLNGCILKLGDTYIVHTEENKKSLHTLYAIDYEKINVIPHGTLKPITIKGVKKHEAKMALGIPLEKKVVLHFGNIRDYKGLDVLLKSMRMAKNDLDNIFLIIAGKPWNDWTKYEKLIEDLGLEKYVLKKLDFISPSDIETYFAAADLVALPYTKFDSQSGVAALAVSFAKPLIITDVGGLNDFVADEKAIAKANDELDLANKIVEVLSNRNLIEKLERDSAIISDYYSWDKIANQTMNVYQKTISGSSKDNT